MATLEELMAEAGLGPATSQVKTASQKPSSKEVNEVLENLGLSGGVEAIEEAGVTKQAAEGSAMDLTSVYENIFSEELEQEEQEGQEKVASETVTEGEEGPTTVLGELVGSYFAVARETFLDKLAGDLEAEAGEGHDPMGGIGHSGQLTSVIGKEKSPFVHVNHNTSSSEPVHTSGSSSPYAGGKGKMIPIVQAYLKRVGGKEALIGAQKD